MACTGIGGHTGQYPHGLRSDQGRGRIWVVTVVWKKGGHVPERSGQLQEAGAVFGDFSKGEGAQPPTPSRESGAF
jgi:hypothetical protein